MEKPAAAQHPIHDLLARRWSPRAFADRPVTPDVLRSLWEAARWAPSCFNEQPWSFIVATKNDPQEFGRMVECLVEGNQVWARQAPVLIVTVAKKQFDHNQKANPHAWHDVGQAVMSLTVQATAMGLVLHQMAGILPDKIREAYQVPGQYEPVAGIALGYPGNPESLSDQLKKKELGPRTRNAASDFVFSARWGQQSKLV